MRKNKLFAVMLMALVFTAASCGHMQDPGPWGKLDWDASRLQPLIEQTVRVDKHTLYMVESVDPKTKQSSLKMLMDGSGGSGVVVNDKAGSLVITAAHVCNTPPLKSTPIGTAVLKAVKIELFDPHGQTSEAEVVNVDPVGDVCVLRPTKNFSKGATLADFMPPLAGHLVAVGGPLGNFDENVATVSEGRYGGMRGPWATMSINVDHGFSGGPVFYQGKLVGIVVAFAGDNSTVSVASPIDKVRTCLDIARKKIKDGLFKKDVAP